MTDKPIDREPPVDELILAGQKQHWAATFAANPDMYGTDPSEPAVAAADLFTAGGLDDVVELGAGQGRDTLYFARCGLRVTALDFAPEALASVSHDAETADLADRVTVAHHDMRQALPLPDASFDACYSHMLFCMALTTGELEQLVDEVRRVVRPGGLVVYTVRTTADAHFGAGIARGDHMYEHGGFVVHFFDRQLIERLARGFELIEVSDFTEGALPRRLSRITMRVPDS